MFHLSSSSTDFPRVADFFHGKSVFLTGASGFVGGVILEDLLRCCPGIQSIYILLRKKKNVNAYTRKEAVLKKKIFNKIKEENPEALNKVHVIAGDISEPNLGLKEEDVHRIIEEVSIIFHCAACISFCKSARFLVSQNVLSTKYITELCRQLKRLDAFVYTSTAFCNSNHFPLKTLPEEVFRLPFPAQKFIDALKNENENTFEDLVAECKPEWPNWYAFSKNMAENLILETASDLPIAIVRPSIIFSAWKTPIPGYVESGLGITALVSGGSQGFVKVVIGDPNTKINLVPVDVVANTHLIAAWSVGTSRVPAPLVVHCVSNEYLNISNQHLVDSIMNLTKIHPVPRSFQMMTGDIFIKNPTIYWFYNVYEHYIPACVFDIAMKFNGKKPRMVKGYSFIDKVGKSLQFFTSHTFNFDRSNMLHINSLLHPDDKEVLDIDTKELTFPELIESLPKGAYFYDWTHDKKSPQSRLRATKQTYWVIQIIKGTFLLLCSMLVYWMFSFFL